VIYLESIDSIYKQTINQLLSLFVNKYGSICWSCKHCKSIDINKEVDCEILGKTTLKIYCRNYGSEKNE